MFIKLNLSVGNEKGEGDQNPDEDSDSAESFHPDIC